MIKIEYYDELQKTWVPVLAIDFAGICIVKGEPSFIVKENDGCIPIKGALLIIKKEK